MQKEGEKSGDLLLKLNDIAFTSTDRVLFYGVNFSVHAGENVVVIGKSGTGKSVLLRIACGLEKPDEGFIILPNSIRIGYVPQDITHFQIGENTTTIRSLFWKASGLDDIEQKLQQIGVDIASSSGDQQLELIKRQSELLEVYEQNGAYLAEIGMAKILRGLKIDKKTTGYITPDTKLNEISSGQRTRAIIGQALFGEPDLLILDDPTRHLDYDSIIWLANYLRRSNRLGSLIATNNVDFINLCADRIVEITDFGRVLSFDGNYNDYVTKRDVLLDSEKKEAEAKKAVRDRLYATYRKFKDEGHFKRSKDFAKVGAAMKTRIRKMDEQIEALPGSRPVYTKQKIKSYVFTEGEPSGNEILQINGIVKKYGDFVALNLPDLNLFIKRGDKLLISGKNGSGKSTLMRLLVSSILGGEFKPDLGIIRAASNLIVAYCSSDDFGIELSDISPLEEIIQISSSHDEKEAVGVLNFWGFSQGLMRRGKIKLLSQGEKNRLALARVMITHPNLILLDEPSTYLEPEIVERLIAAINGYKGTLILISHDQRLLRGLKLTKEFILPSGEIIIRN